MNEGSLVMESPHLPAEVSQANAVPINDYTLTLHCGLLVGLGCFCHFTI